jgi:cholesterol transport system auxiliary component
MTGLARVATFALVVLLAGCSALGGKRTPLTVYAPRLAATVPTTTPTPVDWQLQVSMPQASQALDNARIAVMPTRGVLEVYPAARWRDPAPRLLRSLVVQAFEDSGRIVGVSSTNAGLSADYELAIELRDFQAEVDGSSARAVIRLQAKLFDHRSNRIVAMRAFEATAPAVSSAAGDAVAAFETALSELMPRLVDWTIEAGTTARVARPAP